MQTQIDHLVVVAQTLAQGVQWCEATLGITPAPGGEHAQYGTHNRLFKVATPKHPLAYFEIIAINPGAKRPANADAKRWFDMDDAALRLHPRNSLPRSGVSLQSLAITHPGADKLQAAFDALGLTGVATLKTPKGTVVLRSHGV